MFRNGKFQKNHLDFMPVECEFGTKVLLQSTLEERKPYMTRLSNYKCVGVCPPNDYKTKKPDTTKLKMGLIAIDDDQFFEAFHECVKAYLTSNRKSLDIKKELLENFKPIPKLSDEGKKKGYKPCAWGSIFPSNMTAYEEETCKSINLKDMKPPYTVDVIAKFSYILITERNITVFWNIQECRIKKPKRMLDDE